MEQQKAKKWFIGCMALLCGTLAVLALIMVILDPYFHYHGPLSGLSYRLYEERYINDGISRHFDYNAMITGTSMAQNFRTSEMDALFGTRAVKTTFSGAGYEELSENLDRALQRNPELETVIWAIDYNGLLRDYDWEQYETYPDYLYDNNPFNDVSYLFNKAVLYHGLLPVLSMTLSGSQSTTMDEYSSWEHETGLEHILLSYDRAHTVKDAAPEFDEAARKTVTQTIDVNIVQLVNKYPDTTFYLFYPPYSICYWDALSREGILQKQLQAEQTATELLLKCPNVKLYNFFDRYEVICNTDYYNDLGHYSAEVNSRILNWMAEGTGLITEENYMEKVNQEKIFFGSFDYDSIYK